MSVPRGRYIQFGIATILYTLFTVWLGVYWMLVALPLIFDHFISRRLPIKKLKKIVKIPDVLREVFDWIGAILTALIFVLLVRTLYIEAYTIPTPSMEQSLMVGDYLFVSRFPI